MPVLLVLIPIIAIGADFLLNDGDLTKYVILGIWGWMQEGSSLIIQGCYDALPEGTQADYSQFMGYVNITAQWFPIDLVVLALGAWITFRVTVAVAKFVILFVPWF